MGGGYEGDKGLQERIMKFWGEEALFRGKDCIFCWVFSGLVWSLGGMLQGCTRLLGVLGLGARNPHGILELGSQTGFVPSWQGGRFSFGQGLGRDGKSSREENRRIGELASERGMYFSDYAVLCDGYVSLFPCCS
jgi:hypothetical protein